MAVIAAYSFDAGNVTDATIGGRNGTLFNTPTFPAGHTRLGLKCVSASSQYVEIADSPAFNLGSAWTIMCWVNPTTTTGAMSMFIKQDQWWFGINSNNTLTCGFYRSIGGTASIAATTGVVVDGTWIHLSQRYDGTTLTMTLNGVQDATISVDAGKTMIDSTGKVRMGSWDGATEFLDGILDDARIFNVFLSDAEVQVQMNTPVSDMPAVAWFSA